MIWTLKKNWPMSNMKYSRVMRLALESPWAILPESLATIHDLLLFRVAGGELTAEEIQERIAPGAARNGDRRHQSGGGVAVIPILGTIIPRADLINESSGAISTQRTTVRLREALADPEVGAIVLDIDSPGGQVGGVVELADEIYAARGVKPITAVANNLAASAAYWIASSADEIVVTPSGEVGSIGVLTMHQDISQHLENEGVNVSLISAGRYKVEANPYSPLNDEARAAIQSRVDEYYDMFVDSVARGRGVPIDEVRGGFGEGRVVGAQTAVDLGMADRISTLDEVISGYLARNNDKQSVRADSQQELRRRRLRLNSL